MENIIETHISGLALLKAQVFTDERGHFFESYQKEVFKDLGINANFVQDNQSHSSKGVLRGLHYQAGDFAQAKLIRVINGAIWDVAVDLRPSSPSYGHYYAVELNDRNKLQLFIPRGFAHGFITLENNSIVQYKCDNYYKKEAEKGIHFDDPTLKIKWPKLNCAIIVSEKDQILPNFNK